MPDPRRHLARALIVALLLASALDMVFVRCVAGPDHRAIEPVGHATAAAECAGGHDHGCATDHHPVDCEDSSLLDELTPQRPGGIGVDADVPDFALAGPVAGLPDWCASPTDARREVHRCPRPPPGLRSGIDDFAVLRLLI